MRRLIINLPGPYLSGAATVLALMLIAACSRQHESAAVPSLAPVILISVDTLRSDRLPVYGYRGVATPAIDALRRDGVLYQRAYSHSPTTLPSHVSMMTGLLPTEHGVRNNLGYRLEPAKFKALARRFREHGYATGAAVSSYVLRAETGISDGFDSYDDSVAIAFGGSTSEHQRAGTATVAQARKWIAANGSRPFFFFLHLYEPHAPYTPPEPFLSRYADRYDGEIAAADAAVGDLIAELKSSGLYDRALIIFVSDHGEGLWEHGEDQHGILLYREALQVPAIVKLPHSERAGTSVSEPFELRRVFDLALELTGIATPQAASRPIYAETLYPRIHLGWSELRSVINGRYHYIESSSPELYDLESDPGETRNILASERRVAASMRRDLEAFPAPAAAMQPVDPEEAAKLAALGYIGTPKERSGPLPNPRDQIATLRPIRAAFELAAKHRNGEAIAAMRKLLDRNPALTDVATRLAEVLIESARYDEAIEVYRAAIERSERFSPDLALALAVAYLKAGQPGPAAEHAALAVKTSPAVAHDVLARAFMQQGRRGDARRHVELALETSRRSPRALLLLAELQRDEGQLPTALQTLGEAQERSIALGAGATPYGLDHLRADVFARMDRPQEAVIASKREIANHPQHLQTYANLALIHVIEGRREEAARTLESMAAANPHRGAWLLAAKTLETAGDAAGAARWRARASR